MTLPAELRAEADRRVPGVNAYYHDEPTRALLHRAADALEWRLIESAPRDGTAVLVAFHPRTGLGVQRVAWEESVTGTVLWCVDDYKHGPYPLRGWNDDDEMGWLPLPATPEG